MAYKAFNEDFFRRMVQLAKKGPVNYAFVLDKAAGKHDFALDSKLDAESLFKKLRSHSKIKKGSFGTCEVSGGTITLTPERNVPGLRKAMKELAKAKGWKQKECRLTVPDMEEEEGGKAPKEDGKKKAATAPAAKPKAAEETSSEPAKEAVQETAQETAQVASPPTDPQAAATPTSAPANPFAPQAATPAVNPFAPEDGAPAKGEGEEEAAPESAPAGAELEKLVKALDKGAKEWAKGLESATRDVTKLEKAVAKFDDPRVDTVVKGLRALIKDFPSMDKEIDALLKAARKGDDRAYGKAKKDVQRRAKQIRKYVEGEELIDVAEANPITKVRMRASVSKALSNLEKAIA